MEFTDYSSDSDNSSVYQDCLPLMDNPLLRAYHPSFSGIFVNFASAITSFTIEEIQSCQFRVDAFARLMSYIEFNENAQMELKDLVLSIEALPIEQQRLGTNRFNDLYLKFLQSLIADHKLSKDIFMEKTIDSNMTVVSNPVDDTLIDHEVIVISDDEEDEQNLFMANKDVIIIEDSDDEEVEVIVIEDSDDEDVEATVTVDDNQDHIRDRYCRVCKVNLAYYVNNQKCFLSNPVFYMGGERISSMCIGCTRLRNVVDTWEEFDEMTEWLIRNISPRTNIPFSSNIASVFARRSYAMVDRCKMKKGPTYAVATAAQLCELYDNTGPKCAISGATMHVPLYSRQNRPIRYNCSSSPYWALTIDHITPVSISPRSPLIWNIKNIQFLSHCLNFVKGNCRDEEMRRWYALFLKANPK
ncbi:MAG: hypothetical protein EXX96DRAFT_586657 [Benjaminiella poitrasii]|nr:MAG: hypothetical protein EXX96DRAFT_586657 [Benjaminiella poitrasii]